MKEYLQLKIIGVIKLLVKLNAQKSDFPEEDKIMKTIFRYIMLLLEYITI